MIGRLLKRGAGRVIDLGAAPDFDAFLPGAVARARRERTIDLGGDHGAPRRDRLAAYGRMLQRAAAQEMQRSRLETLATRPGVHDLLPEFDRDRPALELVAALENALRRRGASGDMMPMQMGAIAATGAGAIPGALLLIDADRRAQREREKRPLVRSPEALQALLDNEMGAMREGFQPFQPRAATSPFSGMQELYEPEPDPFAPLRRRTAQRAARSNKAREQRNALRAGQRSGEADWLYDPGPEGWR